MPTEPHAWANNKNPELACANSGLGYACYNPYEL